MSDWFERRVAHALQADVPLCGDERARRKVMERVRMAAADGHPVRRRDSWHRWSRSSIVGISLAAGISGITTLSVVAPATRPGASGLSPVVIGDSVVSTLRDTLRLVRLMFDAPDARRVAIAGDFNHWDTDATLLTRARGSRTARRPTTPWSSIRPRPGTPCDCSPRLERLPLLPTCSTPCSSSTV